jgi:hypothetical protein
VKHEEGTGLKQLASKEAKTPRLKKGATTDATEVKVEAKEEWQEEQLPTYQSYLPSPSS